MTKAVDHPAHYSGKDNPYEVIKVIEAWGLGFCLGNTVKYISRAIGTLINTPTARGTKVDVLDHGYVRLVDFMGGDESVVRAARVSYDAAWRAGLDEKSDEKLINYLWKHKHSTPFEAVTFTFEVKLPIFVWRQWVRHRTWDKLSINELSARYRELPEEYYTPKLEHIGQQSKDNKQGRTFDVRVDEIVPDIIDQLCSNAFREYKWLLEKGVPRELARIVLPLATYTHMFATVNLLNLLKFLTLRDDAHAQYEIRVYAEAMRELAREIVPVCVKAWETNT